MEKNGQLTMFQNPFKVHSIKYLSPSSLNLFISSPAKWVMRYLYKISEDPGPGAHRGTAIHHAVEHSLNNPEIPIEDCIQKAHALFDTKMKNSVTKSSAELDREIIAPTVKKALVAISEFIKQNNAQYVKSETQVKTTFQGIDVNIIGYVDILFDKCFVDLKTTKFLGNSENPKKDLRQVSFYSKALESNHDGSQKRPWLVYVAPAKFDIVEVKNLTVLLNELVNAAHCLRNFLAISSDKEKLASTVVPNFDNNYWSLFEVEEAKKIWKKL